MYDYAKNGRMALNIIPSGFHLKKTRHIPAYPFTVNDMQGHIPVGKKKKENRSPRMDDAKGFCPHGIGEGFESDALAQIEHVLKSIKKGKLLYGRRP